MYTLQDIEIPNCYSVDVMSLLFSLLKIDTKERPTIKEILSLPFILEYIKSIHVKFNQDDQVTTDAEDLVSTLL